jgi:hypothetical protein
MAFLIEVVVNLGMNWTKFLQGFHTSKPLHHLFSSSMRLVRILGPIVEVAPDLGALGGKGGESGP